jgi:uncharacterized protein (DUF4415 family)
MTNELNTPWSLHFDRDGTEDYGIICDAEGNDLVASHITGSKTPPRWKNREFGEGGFWLPEKEGDPVPHLVKVMQLMTVAPKLLAACRMVVDRWEKGDLAGAARACQEAIAGATGQPFHRKEAEARHLHQAAPKMYAALKVSAEMLEDYRSAATGNRTRDRIEAVLEQAYKAITNRCAIR